MQLGMKAKIKALIRIEGDGVAGCSYGFISGTLFFFFVRGLAFTYLFMNQVIILILNNLDSHREHADSHQHHFDCKFEDGIAITFIGKEFL